ncbi:hypothetical protein PMAYCL1PPCAC_32950 [Pristionchus mayeri]|uniref:Uncharacterized protein n=1 Tax=Pristionchus mayeri TaxID=1317129 RepID=A0AAN5DI41_9BILA|nr:hypothetical protein PMAYCL1PPCAC_32950 [Pristionchus mayeri]
MTNKDMIRDKATRAVLIGIPEQDNADDTDQEDLKMNQSDRDRFISCIRQTQACRQSGNVHSYVRRDLTMEELEYDRSLRREAGKRNAEAVQLEWVVRDLRIVRLSNPRPLPPRSQAALERVNASATSVRESVPLPFCPPPSLHTLSPPRSPALCLLTVEEIEDPRREEEARDP